MRQLAGGSRQLLVQRCQPFVLVERIVIAPSAEVENIDLILLDVRILDLGDTVIVDYGLLLGRALVLVVLVIRVLELRILGVCRVEVLCQLLARLLLIMHLQVSTQSLLCLLLEFCIILQCLDRAFQLLIVLILGAEPQDNIGLVQRLGDLGKLRADKLLCLLGRLLRGHDPHSNGLGAVVGRVIIVGVCCLIASGQDAGHQHDDAEQETHEFFLHNENSSCKT